MLPVFIVHEETDAVSWPALHLHIGLWARGLCEKPIEPARLTEMSPLPGSVARLDVFPYDSITFNDGWIVKKRWTVVDVPI